MFICKTSKYFTKTPFFILPISLLSPSRNLQTTHQRLTESLELYKLFEIIPNVSKCKRYYGIRKYSIIFEKNLYRQTVANVCKTKKLNPLRLTSRIQTVLLIKLIWSVFCFIAGLLIPRYWTIQAIHLISFE